MQWVPEPYPKAGGLAAAGFYKLLGRPRLDPLTVLVRETAQNSWDARLVNGHPVGFTIQGWHLDSNERKALSELFVDADRASGTDLESELASPDLLGLYITDRNTKGLSGPLQADESDPNNTYDWVDFVLNVGKANSQCHTGGTYGFGKTISYVVSSANAVVIHTRTRYRGKLQTRLIACAIGDEFKLRGRLYTGRHWWGVDDEGLPRPVTGAEATRAADAMGMPQFAPEETGTNILIVAPDLGGRTPEQAMTFIAESVTWHLWPKLMGRRGQRAMDIIVSWNGEDIPIPRPEDRPPLHGFAQAFQAILDGGPGDSTPGLRMEEIKLQKPKVVAGDLVTVPLVHRDRALVDDGSDPDDNEAPDAAAAITGPCHHVALLRTPELVIEYLEGPAPPEGGTEWAGVFRARDEHDSAFAAAEPPTHDSWNPALLPTRSTERRIVNVGLRQIKAALEQRWSQRKRPTHHEAESTARIADELAHLVRPIEAKGLGRRRRDQPPGRPGPAKPRVDVVYSSPIQWDGTVATLARLRVKPAPASDGTRLQVRVAAALDGNNADDDLDPMLSIMEARLPGETRSSLGRKHRLDLVHKDDIELDLVVRRGPDTTVLFDIDAEKL